jgi:hypothetical protein
VPQRIQRKRTKGWRLPDGAVIVTRPTRWGNPWVLGEALARVPALDGSDWEPEGRISAAGMRHDYHHPDGHVTVHHSRLMTVAEVTETYRRELRDHGRIHVRGGPTIDEIRAQLAGRDLACWCAPPVPGDTDWCHAAVLIDIANGGAP